MNRIIMFFGSIILIAFMMSGCGTFQKNKRMEHWNLSEGYRFNTLRKSCNNSDSLFVVLSFSGGGTRAAAFSYGIMEELKKTEIEWKGERKRLLDEVDIISSVSGGSFTAAYYSLNRERLVRCRSKHSRT